MVRTNAPPMLPTHVPVTKPSLHSAGTRHRSCLRRPGRRVYNRQRRRSAVELMNPIDYEGRYWNRRAAA